MLRKRRDAIAIEATPRGLPFPMKIACMNSNCELEARSDVPTLAVPLSSETAIAVIGGGSTRVTSFLFCITSTAMLSLHSVNISHRHQRPGSLLSRERIFPVARLARQVRESALVAASPEPIEMTGNCERVVQNAVVQLLPLSGRRPPQRFGAGVISMTRRRPLD